MKWNKDEWTDAFSGIDEKHIDEAFDKNVSIEEGNPILRYVGYFAAAAAAVALVAIPFNNILHNQNNNVGSQIDETTLADNVSETTADVIETTEEVKEPVVEIEKFDIAFNEIAYECQLFNTEDIGYTATDYYCYGLEDTQNGDMKYNIFSFNVNDWNLNASFEYECNLMAPVSNVFKDGSSIWDIYDNNGYNTEPDRILLLDGSLNEIYLGKPSEYFSSFPVNNVFSISDDYVYGVDKAGTSIYRKSRADGTEEFVMALSDIQSEDISKINNLYISDWAYIDDEHLVFMTVDDKNMAIDGMDYEKSTVFYNMSTGESRVYFGMPVMDLSYETGEFILHKESELRDNVNKTAYRYTDYSEFIAYNINSGKEKLIKNPFGTIVSQFSISYDGKYLLLEKVEGDVRSYIAFDIESEEGAAFYKTYNNGENIYGYMGYSDRIEMIMQRYDEQNDRYNCGIGTVKR